MKYHITAFFCGFLLDLLLGDPHSLPHPVRLIGALVTGLEKTLRGTAAGTKTETADRASAASGSEQTKEARLSPEAERRRGALLVLAVLFSTIFVSGLLIIITYSIDYRLGVLTEMFMTYQIFATKSLKDESMKVCRCLEEGRLADARKALSMIVGRDTAQLSGEGVAKAAVETVAENTSDGVIAPMLCTALGGPVLGFAYKAVNTMDSMIGYRNERYLNFGRAAARLDDIWNYLPARISAGLMLAATALGGKDFDERRALQIYRRDRRKHASPNSAQTESVCAGALGLRLAGPASYFGKRADKPYIGDEIKKTDCGDIRRANRLLYLTAWLGELVCLALMLGAAWVKMR